MSEATSLQAKGIDATRWSIHVCIEGETLNTNKTTKGRERNDRVEITFLEQG